MHKPCNEHHTSKPKPGDLFRNVYIRNAVSVFPSKLLQLEIKEGKVAVVVEICTQDWYSLFSVLKLGFKAIVSQEK